MVLKRVSILRLNEMWRTIRMRFSLTAIFIASLAVATYGCESGNLIDCFHTIGEMTLDPPTGIPATGNLEAELSIFVYGIGGGECNKPRSDAMVEILSSRNHGGEVVDIIEPPRNRTDSNGRATVFLGSSECGEAHLSAKIHGEDLCGSWENEECVPLQATVVFTIVCNSGESACDCECINLQTDPNHCGACDNVCAAGESCIDGVCLEDNGSHCNDVGGAGECMWDDDCSVDYVCTPGCTCMPREGMEGCECTSDGDCESPHHCIMCKCQSDFPWCAMNSCHTDEQCLADGEICTGVGGQCVMDDRYDYCYCICNP